MKRLKILSDKVVRSLTEERKSRALNNDIRNIKRENAVRGGHANSDRLEALSYVADKPWEERIINRRHLRGLGALPLIKDSCRLVNSSGSHWVADQSCRRAETGSTLAARWAGASPATMLTRMASPTPLMQSQRGNVK